MPSDAGMPLHGGNPLWAEVQALTAERDRLAADNDHLRTVLDEADSRLCDCVHSLPGGMLCSWCSSTSDGKVIRKVSDEKALLDQLERNATEIQDLRAELATARALLADFQGVANRLREATAKPSAIDTPLDFDPDNYPLFGCPTSKPRPYTCPYCQRPVTDINYHEGPADCARERDQPRRLVDDTDPRG